MLNNIAIIVPTLGTRTALLNQTLKSIRLAGDCHIAIVSPDNSTLLSQIDDVLYDQLIQDPMQGLAEAINFGIKSLPDSIEFCNWLGDDDILTPNSLKYCSDILEQDSKCVCVYGKCQYINGVGEPIWMNKSGKFAVPLIRFGPQLIPQPGALFRRAAFNAVGGLNKKYKLAFDLDLLIKLSKVGKIRYIPNQLSSFRWHNESLSVGNRKNSVAEAKLIRQLALPKMIRPFSPLWELPLSRVIFYAGTLLTRLNKLRN